MLNKRLIPILSIKDKSLVKTENFNIPRLYILLDPTVPFVPDPIRYFPEDSERIEFFERITRKLKLLKAEFVTLTGDYHQRERKSLRVLRSLTKESPDWLKVGDDSSRV